MRCKVGGGSLENVQDFCFVVFVCGGGAFPSKTMFLPIEQIPGGSKKVRTTRGVIFRQGFERILSYKSLNKLQKHRFFTPCLVPGATGRCPVATGRYPVAT